MRDIARRIISEEYKRNDTADTEGRAAFRVCAKLGVSLSFLAGNRGFRALLGRALKLAAVELPWLSELTLGPEGGVIIAQELEARLGKKETAKGGAALVGQLIELLVTFMGEALTRRRVQKDWPNAALNSKSGGKA